MREREKKKIDYDFWVTGIKVSLINVGETRTADRSALNDIEVLAWVAYVDPYKGVSLDWDSLEDR